MNIPRDRPILVWADNRKYGVPLGWQIAWFDREYSADRGVPIWAIALRDCRYLYLMAEVIEAWQDLPAPPQ